MARNMKNNLKVTFYLFADISLEYIGSELGPRPDVFVEGVRGVFLFENMKFGSGGAITSFHAYVLEYYPIRFQVWRRTGSNEFTLVGEKRVVPTEPLGMLTVSKTVLLLVCMVDL